MRTHLFKTAPEPDDQPIGPDDRFTVSAAGREMLARRPAWRSEYSAVMPNYEDMSQEEIIIPPKEPLRIPASHSPRVDRRRLD